MDLGRFSPQQCAAITAGEGPLSILAGPGSGKTTTLAGRIAYLVGDRGVPPTSILAIRRLQWSSPPGLHQAVAAIGNMFDACRSLQILKQFHDSIGDRRL